MADESQFDMQCADVEALLAEALDGTLQGQRMAAFEAHQQTCSSCRETVAEARAGMLLLQGLGEAEPPRNLVHNILAQTIGALPSEHAMPAPQPEGWFEKLKARLAPIFAPVVTPRFAMSFGMAFFSITMLLGIAGFHVSDLRRLDFSSKGITRAYYATQARIVRYYENMRLVYEIESRVRDLKRAASPENTPQQPQQEAPANNPKNPSKTDNRQPQTSPTPNHSHLHGQPEWAADAVVPVANPQARRQGSSPASSANPEGTLNRRLI
jgi:putative zinc finger protein